MEMDIHSLLCWIGARFNEAPCSRARPTVQYKRHVLLVVPVGLKIATVGLPRARWQGSLGRRSTVAARRFAVLRNPVVALQGERWRLDVTVSPLGKSTT